MQYKILDAVFKIEKDKLLINNEPYECKQNTIDALLYFLQSEGAVLSKDDILKQVWKDVIVSDASVFKQIQLVREIFAHAGLPKDIIENVYGRGYKLKYDANNLTRNPETENVREQVDKTGKKLFLITIISVLVIVAIYIFVQKNKVVPDYFNKSKRESLVKLINSDWEAGLKHLQELLAREEKHLSLNDFAFLYNKIGLSQYHLQDFSASNSNTQKALEYYSKVNNLVEMAQMHLNLGRNYGFLTSEKDYLDNQKKHITLAIKLLQQTDEKLRMIDAKMVLAEFYKKTSSMQQAIDLYREIISDAKAAKDAVGEMIALNNMAATYVVMNDYDRAIELGQQGLKMALATGKGRYIANSYSFLSDLYQNQYRSGEAIEMIQQAIKLQLANNEYSHLNPKIFTLGFIMVQTYQHEKAEELLDLLLSYLDSLKTESPQSIAWLYKGMDSARQSNWRLAEEQLKKALQISQKTDFSYKQPLNMAYLSLAHYFNQNYIQAIEPATDVFNNAENDKQSRAIAALSLAYSYYLMERKELADKWFAEAGQMLNPKWLFEYKLFLQLKLERQQQNNSVLTAQTENQVTKVTEQIAELSESAKVDEEIYQNLLAQMQKKVEPE